MLSPSSAVQAGLGAAGGVDPPLPYFTSAAAAGVGRKDHLHRIFRRRRAVIVAAAPCWLLG